MMGLGGIIVRNFTIYLSLIWINYKFLTKFRIGPLIFLFSNIISLLGIVFLWDSVSKNGISGISNSTMISYAFIGRIVSMLLFSSLDRRIANDVKKGELLPSLLRPWDLRYYYVSISAGQTLLHLLWMVIPTLVFGCLFGLISFPSNFETILISCYLLFLGYLDIQLVKLIIGFSSVFIIGHRALGALINVLVQIGGGLWFPIAILPLNLQQVMYCLPFAAMGSIPLQILNGIDLASSLLLLVIVQTAWTFILLFVSNSIQRKFFKKIGDVVN